MLYYPRLAINGVHLLVDKSCIPKISSSRNTLHQNVLLENPDSLFSKMVKKLTKSEEHAAYVPNNVIVLHAVSSPLDVILNVLQS